MSVKNSPLVMLWIKIVSKASKHCLLVRLPETELYHLAIDRITDLWSLEVVAGSSFLHPLSKLSAPVHSSTFNALLAVALFSPLDCLWICGNPLFRSLSLFLQVNEPRPAGGQMQQWIRTSLSFSVCHSCLGLQGRHF